jgi:hypothetical protein
MSVMELVEEVLAVQTLRAGAYRRLQQAMQSKDADAIQETTNAFRELSGRILAVINACEDGDGQLMALRRVLREMQHLEQSKLRLTVEIQALKSSHVHEDQDTGIGAEPECGCGARDGPTKHDVEEALREAYVAMEACVQSILQCMEELREMREDIGDV